MKKTLVLAMVAIMALGATTAFAVTGDVTARANVLTPLTVSTGLRDLDFGDVFPGLAKTVLYDAATSGKWSINGEASKEVDISFTLPVNLVSGGNNLPIDFTGNTAAYFPTDVVGSAIAFDPAAGTQEFLAAAGTGFVWIGATVNPGGAQPAGVYTATVTMDVVYTGN